MKKIFLFAICAGFALMAKAQTNMDELKYLQSMFGMDKKHFVAERMQISKADSTKFWALYEDYELFRSEISDKRGSNIQSYSDNYSKLTDKQANDIVITSLQVSDEFTKLLKKTYDKMATQVSAVKAGQFVYLEMYCEALGRIKLAEMIPHLNEVPAKKM